MKALVDTIFVAEPETIDWISHFDPEDIFLDIGANILYGLQYLAMFSVMHLSRNL